MAEEEAPELTHSTTLRRFIAAVQITSLSHIGSASFNTGMTTGNLRGAVSAAVSSWLDPAESHGRERAALLGWMCLAFLVGAILGGFSTRRFGDDTVFVVAALVASANLALWRSPAIEHPPNDGSRPPPSAVVMTSSSAPSTR